MVVVGKCMLNEREGMRFVAEMKLNPDLTVSVHIARVCFVCSKKMFAVFHELREILYSLYYIKYPLDTGRKLNVHKTFRRCPGRLLNVLCAFNLRPVPKG